MHPNPSSPDAAAVWADRSTLIEELEHMRRNHEDELHFAATTMHSMSTQPCI